ncbi:Uncharacterised protein [Chlamydia abortus]|nr:Uncharacterised protein [Chlamydia abortus]
MARKTGKCGKFRNGPLLGRGIWQGKLKIMEKEKLPLDDLKNDEITDKREK